MRTRLRRDVRVLLGCLGALGLVLGSVGLVVAGWSSELSGPGWSSVFQPYLGQAVRQPDGTIAVYDEGEPPGFSIGGVDGGPAYSGDDAAVWRVEDGDLVEMVFRGTEREAWAYMDGLKTPMFTGTQGEYDAWVESQQVSGGEALRLALQILIVGSLAVIVLGAWPSSRTEEQPTGGRAAPVS